MNPILASFIIRLGLAIAFFYAAVSSLLFPDIWIGFLPAWLIPAGLTRIFLLIFTIFQFSLGFWLLSNYKIRYAAIVTVLLLFVIILTNLTAMDLLFRDIPIAFSALALVFISKNKNNI